jgi:hypothetical protein
LLDTVDVSFVLGDVTAETAVVVQGEEAGAAVEGMPGVVLGFRIEVVTVVVGEAETAIEGGDEITTDAAGAAVETV